MKQNVSRKRERRQQIRVNLGTMDETVEKVCNDAQQGRGFSLFTLNLDHLVKLRLIPAFRAAYLRARYVTADGWPVVWLGRRKGADVQRTAGADLIEPLCAEAAKRGLPVYLFGSSAVALRDAAEHLTGRFPALKIVGTESPDYDFRPDSPAADQAIERMARSKAALCFVALGAPKQELFADRAATRCPDMGFLCIGAALDFLGGHQQRAPHWMQ